jgi:hypothetical protein
LIYDPGLVKGLDRQYAVVWEASRALERLREEVRGARSRGDQRPRYLAARRAIDELRVAVSRSNEILIFLDRGDQARDPLLARLAEDGVAEETSPSHLNDVLEARGHDPLELTRGLLREGVDLLDLDLPRALRTLERATATLEELHDPDSRRLAHEQRIQTHRQAAGLLLDRARATGEGDDASADAAETYQEAGRQLREIELSYRQLERATQADLNAVLAERYLETPPGSTFAEENLPTYLARYAELLATLPSEQRSTFLDEPRAWHAEQTALEWTQPGSLKGAVAALEQLADLSGDETDRNAAADLRERLIQMLIRDERWREALDLLEGQPAVERGVLATCYEGLGDWERAAEQRVAAGELEQALEDYRQAGSLERAAELATQLDRSELADALTTAATLARIGQADEHRLDLLTDAERLRLAESLRRAADRLAPRGGGGRRRA